MGQRTLFKKTKSNSIVTEVTDQIEEVILTGQVGPGDRLPSTRELQAQFGASQGTVREALRTLNQKGLIEVKPGAKGGVFVREVNTDPVTEGLARLIRQRRISPNDLAGFRRVVEAGLVHLAARNVSPAQAEELHGYLDQLAETLSLPTGGWKAFLAIEVRVRKLLMKASGSLIYEVVLTPIHDNIFAYALKYISDENADLNQAFDDWKRIIEAVINHDGDEAARATEEHISRYADKMGRDSSRADARERL